MYSSSFFKSSNCALCAVVSIHPYCYTSWSTGRFDGSKSPAFLSCAGHYQYHVFYDHFLTVKYTALSMSAARHTRGRSSGSKAPSQTHGSKWPAERSDRRRLNGDDILTESSSDGDTSYDPDTDTTTSSDLCSPSTESVENIDTSDDEEELRVSLDAGSEKRNGFQSHFSRSLTDQTRTRAILQSLESYWSLLSTIETLPLPPLPPQNGQSEVMIDDKGGAQTDVSQDWGLPMLEALEAVCGESFESEGLKEAMMLVICAGLRRRSTGATRRVRGPHHIIWRDVATAISELRKESERHGECSDDDDNSDNSGADFLGGKRKLGVFEDEDLSPSPPKRRLTRNKPGSTDNNTNLGGRDRANACESRSSPLSEILSAPLQSGLQTQPFSISSSRNPSATSYASRSNISSGRRPETCSPVESSGYLEDDYSSFNRYHSPSESSSSHGLTPASYTPTPASTPSRKRTARRRPSFGSRAFRATSKVYPLYPWMTANRPMAKQAKSDNDSGYEDVFDDNDDFYTSDGQNQSSHGSQGIFDFSLSSSPTMSPQPSTPNVDYLGPNEDMVYPDRVAQDAQAQLLTPQQTPAPNRFISSPSLPILQQLKGLGQRLLFGSQIATLQASSTIRGPNMETVTVQKDAFRDTATTTVAETTVRGRPRAFSDVKRVRLRNGERLMIVPEDDVWAK